MSGGKHEKRGKSRDCRQIYIDMRQAAETVVTASKKALGIYKPNLNNRSFDTVFLSQQRGLESNRIEIEAELYGIIIDEVTSELLSLNMFEVFFENPVPGQGWWVEYLNGFDFPYEIPSIAYANGEWVATGVGGGGGIFKVYTGTDFVNLTIDPRFSRGNWGNDVNKLPRPFNIYINNTWVILTQSDKSPQQTQTFGGRFEGDLSGNVSSDCMFYGPTLDNLTRNDFFREGRINSYINDITYQNNAWVVCGWNNGINNVWYGPTLDYGSIIPYPIFGNGGTAYMARYGNNNWVIVGHDRSGSGNNVYYGSTMGSLTPLAIFGNGGFARSVIYDNGIWVIVGYDKSGLGRNVYYGSNLASLTHLPLFGDGGIARSALYANNTWVIVGDNKSAFGYNVYYGSSLASLTPYAIFGNNGSGKGVFYLNNNWVICGKDTSGSGRNVYYGNTLGALKYYEIFGVGGYAEKAMYEDNTLVMWGQDITSPMLPTDNTVAGKIWYHTNWFMQ
jgi:hypothetical protein